MALKCDIIMKDAIFENIHALCQFLKITCFLFLLR